MLTWLDILKFASKGNPEPDQRVEKTEEEWRKLLPEDVFYVTRKKGTERPFSSEMCVARDPGKYVCTCCHTLLFDSSEKFDSGTGWPSFFDVLDSTTFILDTDHDIGYARTEVMCGKCGGHLGHVFPDGPAPTGLRYCMNGVALDFVKEESAK